METLTDRIRKEITEKYKSIRKFAKEIDEPPSTIVSALKNGVEGSRFDLVAKICKGLGITSETFITSSRMRAIDAFYELDKDGKSTVEEYLNRK